MITLKQLKKLKIQLKELRKNKVNINCKDMAAFANDCGRYQRPGKQGKEPTYLSDELSGRKPLSIPNHTGKAATLKPKTAGSIWTYWKKIYFL